jgi:capsular exopolysaccharide synthesis family protein
MWLIVLVPLVAIAAMGAFMATQEPVHRASTTLVVGEARGGLLPPVLGGDAVTLTLTRLLESDLLARTVIQRLELGISTRTFREKLEVGVLPDTSVLDVSYTSTRPRLALAVVTELADIFTKELDRTLGVRSAGDKTRAPGSFDLVVRVFDPPHVGADPVQKYWTRNLFIAGIAGLVLGVLLAVGRDSLNSRVRSRRDAGDWFQAPVVGALPKLRPPSATGAAMSPSAWGNGLDHGTASLDLLRAMLEFSDGGFAGSTIVVTSATADVGKSTVVASLGAALARAGNKVVLVDADLRRPSLHELFGLERWELGLSDVIGRGLEVDKALVRIDLDHGDSKQVGRLELLPSGSSGLPGGGNLTPDALDSLTEELKKRADYVVYDGPPLIVADAFPLARQSDSVLVVARRGRTTRDQAESVRMTLDRLGVGKVGVVLTNASSADGHYGGY